MDIEKVVQEIENEQGTFVSVLKYHGAFHQDLIHRMLDQLNERVLSTGDEKKIAARVYSVVYELMNNVLFHAKLFQENEAAGFIVVLQTWYQSNFLNQFCTQRHYGEPQ